MVSCPQPIFDAMAAHCLTHRPDEACGVLLGRAHEILAARPLENVWPVAAERPSRFAIDPLAQMHAERAATAEGLDLIGFYHSHPRGPAAPSQFDTDRAWPRYIYLIIGLENPERPSPRAWILDDGGQFVEHPIHLG